MYQMQNVIIRHRIDDRLHSQSKMDVVELSFYHRFLGALISLLICWAAAALAILIPVLHFFLVPLGLIAGLGIFIYKIRLKHRRSQTELVCPSCQAEFVVKSGSFNWPILETCSECRSDLKILPTKET